MISGGGKRATDLFGRQFSYLRLSVTDACNFRCVYCLPNGYQKTGTDPLSLCEIKHLVTAFAELGMWKIRLTGGEPTLRRDLPEIIRVISRVSGVRRIALSTNGYRLKSQILTYRTAGVTDLNVSLDSLNPQRFKGLTGKDLLGDVLGGIDKAFAVGFERVKLNAVLLGAWNEDEFRLFEDWIRSRNVVVRFIELMPTGQNAFLRKEKNALGFEVRTQLLQRGWQEQIRVEGDGPAIEYRHPDFLGAFGVIAPYSPSFCSTCNRLRVTSQGDLRLCLFAEGNYSVRHLLKSASQKEDLKNSVLQLLQKKEISHYLPQGRFGNNKTFSAMGG